MPLWKYNIHRGGRDSLDYRQQFLLRFSLSGLLTSVNKRLDSCCYSTSFCRFVIKENSFVALDILLKKVTGIVEKIRLTA